MTEQNDNFMEGNEAAPAVSQGVAAPSIDSILGASANMEEAKDVLGGGGDFIKDSGIYKMGIVHAYIIRAASGSIGVNLTMKHADAAKTEFNTKVYMTSGTKKGGMPYYEKNGKRFPLPGFTTIDDLCRVATANAHGIADAPRTTKTIEIFDYTAGKKLPQEVEVIDCLTQKMFQIGLVKKLVNKFKDGRAIAETQHKNEISLVMDNQQRTVREMAAGAMPEFATLWAEKNNGTVIDDTTIKAGTAAAGSALIQAPAQDAPAITSDDTDGLFS